MTDVTSSGPVNHVPEHVIDPPAHYDEEDEPAVFLVTVAGMSHAALVCHDHCDPVGSPS